MITRIVIIMLIAVLALPVATLTRPVETSPSLWSDVAVDAKGKKPRKAKKPKFKTVRQELTRTFTSSEPNTIPEEGQANPYPSAIAVSGFSKGTITDVNLLLDDFTHTYPRDVDILLSTSGGHQALVLSDLIDGDDAVDVDLTLDDEAAAPLPGDGALTSGAFRPANFDSFLDTFAAPAPAPDGAVALSTFDGADPNGTWRLWVMDNSDGDSGDLSGWALEITAEVDVKVKAKQKKNKKRH